MPVSRLVSLFFELVLFIYFDWFIKSSLNEWSLGLSCPFLMLMQLKYY